MLCAMHKRIDRSVIFRYQCALHKEIVYHNLVGYASSLIIFCILPASTTSLSLNIFQVDDLN